MSELVRDVPTFADRAPIPTRELLELAVQMADGLTAAVRPASSIETSNPERHGDATAASRFDLDWRSWRERGRRCSRPSAVGNPLGPCLT